MSMYAGWWILAVVQVGVELASDTFYLRVLTRPAKGSPRPATS